MSYESGMVEVVPESLAARWRELDSVAEDESRPQAERDAAADALDSLELEHELPMFLGKRPVVYLPHSCNQWVIGGEEEVRAMIADLQAALETLKK